MKIKIIIDTDNVLISNGDILEVVQEHKDSYLARKDNYTLMIYKRWCEIVEEQKTGPCKPVGKFENIGRTLGELVDNKQQAYGDAITTTELIIKALYPNGIKPEQYRDALLQIRIADKQCRIAKGDKKAFGESPWNDISGYGLLGVGHE